MQLEALGGWLGLRAQKNVKTGRRGFEIIQLYVELKVMGVDELAPQ